MAGAMIERSHHFCLWMRTNSTRWTSTTLSPLERFFKSFEVCIKSFVSTRRIVLVIKSSNLDISISGVWSHWQWTNFEGIAHYHSSWPSMTSSSIWLPLSSWPSMTSTSSWLPSDSDVFHCLMDWGTIGDWPGMKNEKLKLMTMKFQRASKLKVDDKSLRYPVWLPLKMLRRWC